MKKIFILILLCFPLSIFAQQKFIIDKNYSISLEPTKEKFKSITFTIDANFIGKEIGIFDESGKNLAALNKQILGDSISKDINGNFTITIMNNHKVKECPNELNNVPDIFTIKLDNKFFGPFYLSQKEESITKNDKKKAQNIILGKIIYYDAIYINNFNHIKDSCHSIKSLLKIYGIGDTNQLKKNPFLKMSIADTVFSCNETQGKNIFNSFLPAVGNIDVTNFAKGLSLFLIDRAKEELTIAFFDKFKKKLNEFPALKILFPNTSDRIVNLLGYQYTDMLPELQKAFKKDLDLIPENLIEVLLMPDYYQKIESKELIIVLNSYNLLKQINSLSAAQLIEALPNIAMNNKKEILDTNIYNVFKLSSIFSNSIRENDTIKNWVSYSDFYNNIMKDTNCYNIYLGLLYQQIINANIKICGVTIDTLFQKNNYHIFWYKNQISKLFTLTDKINSAYINIKKFNMEGRKPDFENIVSYFNTTIELSEFGYNIIKHYNNKSNLNFDYIILAKEVNNLYMNSCLGEYNLAIHSLINILNKINELNIENKHLINSKIIEFISIYGVFIANVADAKKPEDVKVAIENATLPSGSSSYKKYNKYNLSINGYLGANCNFKTSSSANDIWKKSFNMTAPVGFNLSFLSLGKGGAVSVFIPLIDVGAIANYQLSKDSTTIDQKIYLRNIFSPGAYLVYGFGGNWPMSVALGGQYGPGLYKMGADLINPTWRWNAFLTVDIPMFNLTKGRRISKK